MAEHWEHKTLTLEQDTTGNGALTVKLVNDRPLEQCQSSRTFAQWLDELANDNWETQTIIPGNQFIGQTKYFPTVVFRKLVKS